MSLSTTLPRDWRKDEFHGTRRHRFLFPYGKAVKMYSAYKLGREYVRTLQPTGESAAASDYPSGHLG